MRRPLLTCTLPLLLLVTGWLTACATGNGDPSAEGPATDQPAPTGTDAPTPAPTAKPTGTTPPTNPPKGTPDASTPTPTPTPTNACPGYAAPHEAATCKCAVGKICDANNCFGGYYCELSTTPPKCVRKPASCP